MQSTLLPVIKLVVELLGMMEQSSGDINIFIFFATARISLREEEFELQDKGWFRRYKTNPHATKALHGV